MRLIVGVITNRPRFWPWLQRQLASQEIPDDVEVCLISGVEDGTAPPDWIPGATHYKAFFAPSVPLHRRYTTLLELAQVQAPGWLCWVGDDDLLAPTHLATLVQRVRSLDAPTWAVGTNLVPVLDAREDRGSLLACPADAVVVPQPFCAFVQTAFRLAEGWIDTLEGHDFPPTQTGSDTGWVYKLIAEFGPPKIAHADVTTYVAIAHGTNRCNDARVLKPGAPTLAELAEDTRFRAFPRAALDVRHPAWDYPL